MARITQFSVLENELASMISTFFRSFNIAALLKKSGVHKMKGVAPLTIFRTLFELAFIHSTFAAIF